MGDKRNNTLASDEFLHTFAWRKLRMVALKKYGARCQCCGASPANGAVMNVDHIKPRAKYPELALSLNNLQVLCGDCNHGKGNWDESDWRTKAGAKVNSVTVKRKKGKKGSKKQTRENVHEEHRPCPRCQTHMKRKVRKKDQKIGTNHKHVYSEWDVCPSCKHVQHYITFRMPVAVWLNKQTCFDANKKSKEKAEIIQKSSSVKVFSEEEKKQYMIRKATTKEN